jgi:hypothetical protein
MARAVARPAAASGRTRRETTSSQKFLQDLGFTLRSSNVPRAVMLLCRSAGICMAVSSVTGVSVRLQRQPVVRAASVAPDKFAL